MPKVVTSEQAIRSAIVAALKGKYEEFSESDIARLIHDEFTRMGAAPIDHIDRVEPTVDVHSDVRNHIRAYVLLDQRWSVSTSAMTVQEIHRVVCGESAGRVTFRQSSSVPDFPGLLPTPVADIPRHTDRINRLLSGATDLVKAPISVRARFLAELFSAIVSVHPFQDGNGRTARLSIQYCVRCWGLPFVVIPKVRNDDEWRLGLIAAVDGQLDGLARYFESIIAR